MGFGSSQCLKELHLEEASMYCAIPLAHWNQRRTFPSHELLCGNGVTIEVPDGGAFDGEDANPPPFSLRDEADVEPATRFLESKMDEPWPSSQSAPAGPAPPRAADSSSGALPWVTLASGATAGLATATAAVVSKVSLGVHGLYMACGPFAAGYGSGSLTAIGAAAASATVMGGAVAVGVTAAVYFIRWRKLASWLLDAFDHFVVFLKSLWKKIQDGFSFLKDMLMGILKLIRGGISALGSVLRSILSRQLNSFNSHSALLTGS